MATTPTTTPSWMNPLQQQTSPPSAVTTGAPSWLNPLAQQSSAAIPANASPAGTYSTKFRSTQGWYMALGVVTAIMVGNTQVAPFALGILSIALLYQAGQWLQHK